MSIVDLRSQGEPLICLPQIGVDDVAKLAAMGFKTLVCNRPDDEDGVVASATIAQAAEKAGMRFVFQPVDFGSLTAADGSAFVRTLQTLPGPVAAYCRTGRRSVALWAMGRAPAHGVQAVLDASRQAGCDLEGLRSRLPSANHAD
jgi:sulfide:quinone oxidoreductase